MGRRYRAREYDIEEDCEDGVGTCAKGGCRKVFVAHGQTIHQQHGQHGSYQAVGMVAYMAVVREAEAVQVWNANVGALMLHPRIRSHLRAQLFIHCARVLGFSKLVWHRTPKDELLVEAGRSYLDRYTDIEAATNPLILCIDNTGISIAEPQVVLNKSLNSLSLVLE